MSDQHLKDLANAKALFQQKAILAAMQVEQYQCTYCEKPVQEAHSGCCGQKGHTEAVKSQWKCPDCGNAAKFNHQGCKVTNAAEAHPAASKGE